VPETQNVTASSETVATDNSPTDIGRHSESNTKRRTARKQDIMITDDSLSEASEYVTGQHASSRNLSRGNNGRRVTTTPSESQTAESDSIVTVPQHPSRIPNGKAGYVNIQISRKCHTELGQIQERTLLRTKGQVVDYLIETAQTESPIIPTASLGRLFATDVPVQLCGRSGSYKSLFLKSILPNIPHPCFITDIAGEYQNVKRLTVGDFYSFKWDKAEPDTRVRFVPTNNAQVAASELRTVFQFLNTEKMRKYQPNKIPSGILAKWVVLVEESHRLSRESSFLHFLYESRKFTRKIIAVASDPSLFGNVCELLRPPDMKDTKTFQPAKRV